jgi:hypothetical protein
MSADRSTAGKHLAIYSFVVTLVVIALGIITWGFDKGFLFSDGGHYVLRYQEIQPIETHTWITEHVLVKAVVPESLRSIKALRYLGFFLNLIGTFLFGLAITKAYREMHTRKINIALLTLVLLSGFVLSYVFLPAELSYNNLSQFFLVGSVTLLILSFLGSNRWSAIFSGLAGIMSAFLMLVKIPAGLAFSLLVLIVILISGKRNLIISFVVCVVSVAGLLVSIFDLNVSWYFSNISQMLGNSTLNQFKIRAAAPLGLLWELGKSFVVALIVSMSWWFYKNKPQECHGKVISLIALTLTLTVFIVFNMLEHLQGSYISSSFLVMMIFLAGLSVILREWPFIRSPKQLLQRIMPYRMYMALFILLLLSPYAGAVGSWIELDVISKYFLVLQLGLIVLILPWTGLARQNYFIAGLSLYVVLVGLWQYIQYPYLIEPLYKQTVYYKGVKYDPATADFLKDVDGILAANGFSPAQGIIAPMSPGLVYLMGSYQPGGILWSEEYSDEYLENLSRTRLCRKPVIILQSDNMNIAFSSKFKKVTGIDFVNDYKLVGNCYCPSWISFIYFPKEPSSKTAIP